MLCPRTVAYRFGPFAVEVETGILQKNGTRLRLPRQPFEVLLALLEANGALVSREDLRSRLWPEDHYVDFAHGLDVAIGKLRNALCDSAATPAYIETIPGRGYRLLVPIERIEQAEAAVPPEPAAISANGANPAEELPVRQARVSPARWKWMAATGALAILLLSLTSFRSKPAKSPTDPTAQRVTTNTPEFTIISSAISPDGKYLAYITREPGVWLREMETQQLHHLKTQPATLRNVTWFPDSVRLLATDEHGDVWRFSILDGSGTRTYGPAFAAAVSPDGQEIAFTSADRKSIWVTNSNGEGAKRLMQASGTRATLSRPAWSPKGERIAWMLHYAIGDTMFARMESASLRDRKPQMILARQRMQQILWLGDGRILYAGGDNGPARDLWAIAVDSATGRALEEPHRLTRWPNFSFAEPSATRNGNTLAVLRTETAFNVYVADLALQPATLTGMRRVTFDTAETRTGAWEADSSSLLVESTGGPASGIFRQSLQPGPTLLQALLASANDDLDLPRLTADGRWLLCRRAVPNPHAKEIVRVPLDAHPQPATVARLARPVAAAETLTHLSFGRSWLNCPLRGPAPCVISEEPEGVITFSSLDPATGARRRLLQLTHSATRINWDLSPAGNRLLLWTVGPEIRTVDLRSGKIRTLPVHISGPKWLAWTADGRHWLMTHDQKEGAEVVLFDERSRSTPLWKSSYQRLGDPIPSPDGRHFAFSSAMTECNVWLLHSF